MGSKDGGGAGDNLSYKKCKAQVKLSLSTYWTQLITDRMPFLQPNQQCQST